MIVSAPAMETPCISSSSDYRFVPEANDFGIFKPFPSKKQNILLLLKQLLKEKLLKF